MTPRYSSRLSWPVRTSRFADALASHRQAGTRLLDLTISNPTAANLIYPHGEIANVLGCLRQFDYQPDPAGSFKARQAIAGMYGANGIAVAAEHILLTASTSEAYAHLFKLLCDPGDEILVPLPSYPLFEFLAALEGVRTVPYWLRYDGNWHVDLASVESAINGRTRAIVVVNPNNPTGSFLKREEAAALVELARRKNLPVISDEVFTNFALSAAHDRVQSFADRSETLVFSLNGLSKSCGMPQMKLGWIVISGPDEAARQSRERLEFILDTYLSPSTPVQSALPSLLAIGQGVRQQIQERTRRNYEALKHILAGAPANALHTEAGWSSIVQIPRNRWEEEWILTLLNQQHVVTQPGYFFDMPNEAYLVLSLLTDPEVFDEGVKRIIGSL
ncbi:MAG TPA: pyridoxal phosphate-dependent aminotransferase [Bryobacteraceae bacterium]|nr:pyridoxal phosphate-dependent aminotransferase [Bryobacteraceae bacterium]